jgi:hypothetical protein
MATGPEARRAATAQAMAMRWSPCESTSAARRLLPAGDAESIVEGLDVGAQAAQVVRDGFDAVGLLDAQFGGVLHEQALFAAGAEHGQHGNFVDQGGGPFAFDRSAFQVGAAHEQVAHGLAVPHGDVEDFHLDAHGDEEVDERGAGRVQAHAVEDQVRAGHDRRGHQEEGRGAQVAGHGEFARLQPRAAVDADPAGAASRLRRRTRAADFGVVARGRGFAHRGDALGVQAGEQDAALHLGAGHGHR